jgi:5-methylthioadenosine/S-adenosylhomocysteine deaminase
VISMGNSLGEKIIRADILLKDGYLLSMDQGPEVIEHCDVAIRENRIAMVGLTGQRTVDARRVIDARGKVIMPGLINCHTHCGMTIFRGIANDLPLMDWLHTLWPLEDKLTGEMVYWISLLSIAEMIKSGTTTFADMYFHMDATARAVEDSGIRAVLARGLQGIKYDTEDIRIRENQELYDKWHGRAGGRIRVMAGPHAVYTCSEEYLKGVLDFANKTGMGVHIHVSETVDEVRQCKNTTGMTPVAYLNKLGLFDCQTVAAHCVHVTREDMEILKEKQVGVVYNPSSNCKLASGFAPVVDMERLGISIGLGTDGASSNNNLDMFREIRIASLINKVVSKDATALPAGTVLTMATLGGSRVLDWPDIGTIKEGKLADIILVDIDKIHFYPVSDIKAHLVYSGAGSDVSIVIIDGRVVLDNGILVNIDEARVKHRVQGYYKAIMEGTVK